MDGTPPPPMDGKAPQPPPPPPPPPPLPPPHHPKCERTIPEKDQSPADQSEHLPRKSVWTKPGDFELVDLRRTNILEIMLTKFKMLPPDIVAAILAMDDSILDADQIEDLTRFFPTKEQIETLKNYTGDKTTLGKCEQYFLELMKVPRIESKLRVFSFKIQFGTQITELKKNLNVVKSASEEICTSQKLKEIMKNILYLGNTLNQGTARGDAVGFRLTSLLQLSKIRAAMSKMTLMHYLCKVLASKASVLLDFHKDLENLEPASKIHFSSLAKEMQAVSLGLNNLDRELAASETDGPVSDVFRITLKDFISTAEIEVATVSSLYSATGTQVDSLIYYFGEDPRRYPFDEVTSTLLQFTSLFKKAQKEIVKIEELEKNKAAKGVVMEEEQGVSPTRKSRMKPFHWIKKSRAFKGSLWDELQRQGDSQMYCALEFDVSEIETLFSDICGGSGEPVAAKSEIGEGASPPGGLFPPLPRGLPPPVP